MRTARDILVLAFGNPARGDDGLGPAFARAVDAAAIPGVTATWAYQPSVEQAAEVAEQDAVVFVDASRVGAAPFTFRPLLPRATLAFSTHALAPEAVLALARDTLGWRGEAHLLALRGYSFEMFEESLTSRAEAHLREGVDRLVSALARGRLDALVTDPPTDHSDRGEGQCQTATT